MNNIEQLHQEIDFQYQHAVDNAFIAAIHKKDITTIQYCCSSGNLSTHPRRDVLNQGLLLACQVGYLPAVDYILTSPDIQDRPSFNEGFYSKFKTLCEHGHLDIIKYCIEQKVIHPMDNGDAMQCMEGIKWAAKAGHVPIIHYLVHHPEIMHTFDPHSFFDSCFENAVQYNHLHVVQYLFRSHDIGPYINIHMKDDIAIQKTVQNNNVKMAQYLLFSSDITDHPSIDFISSEGKSLFDLAMLYEHTEILNYFLSLRGEKRMIWDTNKYPFAQMFEYNDYSLLIACLKYLYLYEPILYIEADKKFEEYCTRQNDWSYYYHMTKNIKETSDTSPGHDEIMLSI